MDQLKVCGRCREAKPLSEFSKNRSKADGLCHYCRPCKAAAAAERYQRYPEKLKAVQREWYESNREYAVERARRTRVREPEKVQQALARHRTKHRDRRRNAQEHRRAAALDGVRVYGLTDEQIAAKVQYWGGKCWMCGGPFEAIDHVKPLSKGGPHMLANLRPSCRSCNCRKRNRWPLERLM